MSRYRLAAAFLALSSVLLASPALRPPPGNVLVVDASGAGQYTTIQAAVDAALDGDVLLVRTGTYCGFRMTNKGLTVVEDAGANVQVQGAMRVRNLAADKTVVLAGLSAVGDYSPDEQLAVGLFLLDNLGHVRVQDCSLTGGHGPAGNAATIHSSDDVAFVACTLVGGTEYAPPWTYPFLVFGSKGLEASAASTVTVYGSSVRGHDGPSAFSCEFPGSDAGDGAQISGTVLFSSKSSFLGGRGGDCELGIGFACPYGGSGGDGIQASASLVRVLDSVTDGGPGGNVVGTGCGWCGDVGYVGYDRNGSMFSDIAGTARSFVAPNPVRGGVTELVTLRGQPGDRVDLFIADSTSSAQYVAPWHGVLLVPLRAPPVATRALLAGTVPGNGVIHFPLTLPTLQPGTPSRTLFIQALFTDAQGQRYLSGARGMTILP